MSKTLREWRQAGYGSTLLGSLIVLVFLFPVFWMVSTSLKAPAGIFATPPALIPSPLVFDAYRNAVFGDPNVMRAIGTSLIISTGAMLLTLALAAPAAYGLARLQLPGGALVLLLLLVSQLLPSIVIAGPLFVLFTRLQLVNSYLGLILADTTLTLPFAVIVLRPFFLSVPRDLEAAALVDGASRFRIFLSIFIPNAKSPYVIIGTGAFLGYWNSFLWPAMTVTSSQYMQVMQVIRSYNNMYSNNYGVVLAGSAIAALPPILVFLLFQRHIVKGLMISGIK